MSATARHLTSGRTLRAVVAAARNASTAKDAMTSISVMTYNILAQKYVQSGWHSYCPTKHLKWESRKKRLLEEIEEYDSDIICLQEVETTVFANELQPWMDKRGYRGHYLARQYGENVQYPPEGVALFYRDELFDLLHLRSFIFAATPTNPPAPLSPSQSSDGEDGALAALTVRQSVDSDEALTLSSAEDEMATSGDAAEADATSAAMAIATAGAGAGGVARPAGRNGGSSSTSKISSSIGIDSSSNGRTASTGGAAAAAGGDPTRSAARSAGNPSTSGRGGSSGSGRTGCGVGGGNNNEFWSVFLRRQEGAILAMLRHRPTGRPLLAAVTHLFWNPAFPDVKAFQASVLCQEMAAFLERYGGEAALQRVPVVLAGDFNSLSRKRVPDVFDPRVPRGPSGGLVSGVYSLLTRGRLPPDHADHPATRRRPGETGNRDFWSVELTTSGLQLSSAYCLAHGRDPPLTTRTATFAGCLDYIFVTPEHFDVTGTLDLPYHGAPGRSYDNVRDPLTDVDFPPIPNDVFPSDHLSLAALLQLKD